jgi:hypothetical protein
MSEIVKTIVSQIGNKCLFMLGAKNLVSGGHFLTFRIRGSKKVNSIKILLNDKDLYNLTFVKIHGDNVKEVAFVEDVCAENMHQVIESNTGLRTSL